jgi:hypothetical protein
VGWPHHAAKESICQMEHVVEVVYRRNELTLVDLADEFRRADVSGIVLDVCVNGRPRCRVRGVVTKADQRGWSKYQIGDRGFVGLMARAIAERLRVEVLVDPQILRENSCPTMTCGAHIHRDYPSLVAPMPGAVVLSFTAPSV